MNVVTLLRADLNTEHADHARIRDVARTAGVPYFTLRKLVKGYTKSPSFATAEKLRHYYEQKLRRSSPF